MNGNDLLKSSPCSTASSKLMAFFICFSLASSADVGAQSSELSLAADSSTATTRCFEFFDEPGSPLTVVVFVDELGFVDFSAVPDFFFDELCFGFDLLPLATDFDGDAVSFGGGFFVDGLPLVEVPRFAFLRAGERSGGGDGDLDALDEPEELEEPDDDADDDEELTEIDNTGVAAFESILFSVFIFSHLAL